MATLRPDGSPQATTVGYPRDGLMLHFLCGRYRQEAAHLAHHERVSLTIDHDTAQAIDIAGLSMAAPRPVTEPEEGETALRLTMAGYPEQTTTSTSAASPPK